MVKNMTIIVTANKPPIVVGSLQHLDMYKDDGFSVFRFSQELFSDPEGQPLTFNIPLSTEGLSFKSVNQTLLWNPTESNI